MKTNLFSIEVKKILLMDWDPIGIQNIPEAQTEYDAYVPGLCQLLREFQPIEKIYQHLCWIAVDRMGLENNESHVMEIAKKLVDLSQE